MTVTVPIHITDPEDARISDYRCLTDLPLRTRFEPPNGLFIGEGRLVIERALRAGYQMRSALVDAKRGDEVEPLVGDAPCYTAAPNVLEAITGFHVHRGLLASFHRQTLPDWREVMNQARRMLILEGINNHTNIGAVFRSAAALGIDAVLLTRTCADPLYRRSVRVSMGEVFALPYAYVDDWPAGLDDVRAAGFNLLALTPDADAMPIQQLPTQMRRRPALMFGAEGDGLTASSQDLADTTVRIPMQREVDSLNVAASAAVVCWELCRE